MYSHTILSSIKDKGKLLRYYRCLFFFLSVFYLLKSYQALSTDQQLKAQEISSYDSCEKGQNLVEGESIEDQEKNNFFNLKQFSKDMFHTQILGIMINLSGSFLSYLILDIPPSLIISMVFQTTASIVSPTFNYFITNKQTVTNKQEVSNTKKLSTFTYYFQHLSLSCIINLSGNIVLLSWLDMKWTPSISCIYISIGTMIPIIYLDFFLVRINHFLASKNLETI